MWGLAIRVAYLAVPAAACTTTGDVLEAADGDGTGAGTMGGSGTEAGASTDGTGAVGNACGDPDDAWWCPEPGLTWQVQRQTPIDLMVIADVYSVPLFTIDVATIATLRGADHRVICWFSAGISAWGEPDRDIVFPATGPDIVPGQSERWMDLASPIIRDAMAVRLDQAAALGCDAVEPGDIDGYLADSGLPLTREGTVEFMAWLATEAHARGLAIALNDGNELAAELEPSVDLAIDYGCLVASTCGQLGVFTDAGKLVLHAELIAADAVFEVEQMAVEVCADSTALSLVTIFKKTDLNAWIHPCA